MVFDSAHVDPDSSHPRRSENFKTLYRLKGVMNIEMLMNEDLTNTSFPHRKEGESAYNGLRKEPGSLLRASLKQLVPCWEAVSGTRVLKH